MVILRKAINRGLDGLISGTAFMGVALVVALALFVVLVILARFVTAINLPGYFDAAMYCLVIFPPATAAYGLREGKHISVDFLVGRLSARARAALDIPVYLASLIFAIVLTWQGYIWASSAFSTGSMTSGVWAIPKVILLGFITFSGFLLSLQIIRMVLKNIGVVSTKAEPGAISSARLRDNSWSYVTIFIAGTVAGTLLFTHVSQTGGALFLFFLFLFFGMPVFLAMGLFGCVGLYLLIGSSALMQVPMTVFNSLYSFPLTCLPLYILGGMIIERGKIADSLFSFFALFTRRFPASLLIATIFLAFVLCATTGSSLGALALLTALALPILRSRGFSVGLCAGVIGTASMATLIPPSSGLVVTSAVTDVSIAKLFMAALLPGIVIFALSFAYVIIRGIVWKSSLYEGGRIPPEAVEQISWKERFRVTRRAVWGLLTPPIVLGGIYMGIFTPTESAAILVLYGFIVCVLITRTIKLRDLPAVAKKSAELSSTVLCIIFSAFIFTLVVSQLQISASLVEFVQSVGLGANALIAFLLILLLVMGMFMDASAVKLTTLPIFWPVAQALGIEPFSFCIFYQILCEVGLLTPPVGLGVFVMSTVGKIPLKTAFLGNVPFVLFQLAGAVAIFIFPALVTWLPGTMH